MASFRWFPFTRADGPRNMAADDVLLHRAAEKEIASFRFYGWSQATVSLGYFQSSADRLHHFNLASLPWVRRSSGGKTLVHHHELTYALALPPGFANDWMHRMHRNVILPGLNRLGFKGHVHVVEVPRILGQILCFEQQTQGDLVCAGKKVVGSAQRKYRKSLLQHGAILLFQSEHAAELPGIQDITGVEFSIADLQTELLKQFEEETGWPGIEDQWSVTEEKEIEKIAHQYASKEWNEKR